MARRPILPIHKAMMVDAGRAWDTARWEKRRARKLRDRNKGWRQGPAARIVNRAIDGIEDQVMGTLLRREATSINRDHPLTATTPKGVTDQLERSALRMGVQAQLADLTREQVSPQQARPGLIALSDRLRKP